MKVKPPSFKESVVLSPDAAAKLLFCLYNKKPRHRPRVSPYRLLLTSSCNLRLWNVPSTFRPGSVAASSAPRCPWLALSLTLGCPPVPVPKGPPPALGGCDGPWLVAVHLLSPETATSCFSANAYPLDLPPTLLGVCQPEYTAVSAGDSVTSSS